MKTKNYLRYEDKSDVVSTSYSIFLAFVPVMELYQSVIPILNIAEIFLIIFVFFSVIRIVMAGKKMILGKKHIQIQPFLLVLFWFVTTLFVGLVIQSGVFSIIDVINRFLRIILWAFSISISGYYFLKFNLFRKWVIRISLVATYYIILQTVIWNGLGVQLPYVISNGFLTPSSIEYADTATMANYYSYFYYRPASFFGEPAYYSYYVLLGIVLILFTVEKDNKSRIKKAIFLSFGVVLSTSTAGIYLLLLVWMYYIYIKITEQYRSHIISVFVYFCICVAIVVIGILALSIVFVSLGNLFTSMEQILMKPFNFVESARGGVSYSLFDKLQGIHKVIGVGIGNEDIYLELEGQYYNSLTIILLGCGYLGIVAFLVFILNLYKQKGTEKFILTTVYFVLCFTSAILYSHVSILYLTVVYYKHNKNSAKKYNEYIGGVS